MSGSGGGMFGTRLADEKSAKGGPVERNDQQAPKTFADIPAPKSTNRCSRCGKPGLYKFTMYVKPDGRAGSAIVSRTYAICEPCGVFLVTEVQKVFEK
jgi:hypothetical protein